MRVFHETSHKFLVLKTINRTRHPRPFRFEEVCHGDASCNEEVEQAFLMEHRGLPSHVLCLKLCYSEKRLKIWNRRVFGRVEIRLKDIKKELIELQEKLVTFNEAQVQKLHFFEAEDHLINQYNEALMEQATIWSQKNTIGWYRFGDMTQIFSCNGNSNNSKETPKFNSTIIMIEGTS
ncbi:hypothetical protein FRX31_002002 [Thalictrum thalictroides]|uniref:Uncharacterized protein n=1 Tax=Thalictrum thalictroides TaxID=46969 RepID=A0A7J6XHU4_THATH|nr:hypothetical protein FRX31_002002 [Thalictrum thalictroides]